MHPLQEREARSFIPGGGGWIFGGSFENSLLNKEDFFFFGSTCRYLHKPLKISPRGITSERLRASPKNFTLSQMSEMTIPWSDTLLFQKRIFMTNAAIETDMLLRPLFYCHSISEMTLCEPRRPSLTLWSALFLRVRFIPFQERRDAEGQDVCSNRGWVWIRWKFELVLVAPSEVVIGMVEWYTAKRRV